MLVVEQVEGLTFVAVVPRTDPMLRVRVPFPEIGVQTTFVVDFGATEHSANCDSIIVICSSSISLRLASPKSDKPVTKETVRFKRGRGLEITASIAVPVRIEGIVSVSLFVLETMSKAAV